MRTTDVSGNASVPPGFAEDHVSPEPRRPSLPADGSAVAAPRPCISIALIDPKPLTRELTLEMLVRALPDYHTFAATASNCGEFLDSPGRPADWPHLLIVHVRNDGMRDAWVQNELELIKLRLPDAIIVVLSDRDDVDDIIEAVAWGVRGYIPTCCRRRNLHPGIRVARGRRQGRVRSRERGRTAGSRVDGPTEPHAERGLGNPFAARGEAQQVDR
jgi:DNA-binding NarL/FixJ family response regulator